MLGGFGAGEEGIDDSEVSKCGLGITLFVFMMMMLSIVRFIIVVFRKE